MSFKKKYVTVKNDLYYYTRGIPQQYQAIANKTRYVAPMKLHVSATSQLDFDEKYLELSKDYEQLIQFCKTQDPDDASHSQLIAAAKKILRSQKLTPGLLKDYEERGEPQFDENHQYTHSIYKSAAEKADELIPDIEEAYQAYQQDTESFHDKATSLAWQALLDASKLEQQHTSEILKTYLEDKKDTLTAKSRRDCITNWNRFYKYLGDHLCSTGTAELINWSLDSYRDERLKHTTAKGTPLSRNTIKREVTDLFRILNYIKRKWKLNWNLIKPEIVGQDAKTRYPLNKTEQLELVRYCTEQEGQNLQSFSACLCLLYLQGGVMPSEVSSLNVEDVLSGLASDIPHIVIPKGKTTARARVVPIVFALEFIKQHIEQTIAWCHKTSNGNHYVYIKRFIAKALPHSTHTFTGHCLRHSLAANANSCNVDSKSVALIAGWGAGKAGVSRHMLHYGSESLAESDFIVGLRDTSRIIHKHLLDTPVDNVVELNSMLRVM
ncbi:hypothetical protein NLG07_03905 [Alteromonas sp. LMIT006]|uniref:hypothetical protein n=1 Tax=Alteromonadaceae TaxID=72275 RepID=UPI0020CA4DA6|nr:hypothetical protein [Alteromonas sp. LMIT006]UTP73396.1 hypothetical protein NLG07_03905 [Alteromonas sp. LMIT006]